MLRVEDVHVSYGGIRAISGVSMHVPLGSVVAIIGANGAGKSTLLKAISGLVIPQEGRIVYNDRDLIGMAAHRIVGLGLAQVPEGRQLFAHLTVKDNIRLGAFTRAFKRNQRKQIDADYQRVLDLFPVLARRSGQIAGTLSGGEQQMLAIGRSLMAAPKLLLLDEPSMGLAPLVVSEIMAAIAALNADGVTVVLVEQNARSALAIAHHAYVLETGVCVLDGTGAALMEDPKVQAAYLGGETR